MQISINELYNQIKDLKTEKEFEEEVSKRQKDFDSLFDRETVALLIVDELGRNKQNISKISELKQGIETTVYARVTNIGKQRSFNRKNGSSGRVLNLEISDETGSCGLALWDDGVELVKNKKIKIGSNLKVINGYVKNGFNGIELNSGRWSIIEVEPDTMPVISENKIETSNSNTEIEGALVEVDSTRPFFKDSGEYGFVTNIKIKTDDGVKQLTVWDEKVKEIQKFQTGDRVLIKNFDIQNKNGASEIHLNGHGVIKKV